eukprot:UN03018
MADFFTTAVRTGSSNSGHRGVSALVIPRGPGVKTTHIKVSTYAKSAGTAYIEFNNVKVPKEYLLGQENKGFKVVMANFNHERWMIAAQALGIIRVVVEECLYWANQRIVFGKPFIGTASHTI